MVSQIADVTAEVNSAVGDVIGKGVDWSSCGTTNNVNALDVHEWLLDGSVGAVTSAVGGVAGWLAPTLGSAGGGLGAGAGGQRAGARF